MHEAERLIQQALLLETQSGGPRLPEVGMDSLLQAEILREWNQLDCAHSLATEALSLCEQSVSLVIALFFLLGVRSATTYLPLVWRCGCGMHFPPAG